MVQIIGCHISNSIPSRRTIACWGLVVVPLLLAIRNFVNAPADFMPRVSFSSYTSWISRGVYAEFETLSPSFIVDSSFDLRLPPNDENCNDIIVFMPYALATNGQGSQINNYLLAVLFATFLEKPMVFNEPPRELNRFSSGSQFGCPAEAFEDGLEGSERGKQLLERFPDGLNRLIRYPQWISRGCNVPSCVAMEYKDRWRQLRIYGTYTPEELVCNVEHGEVKIMPLTGYDVRDIFSKEIQPKIINRNVTGYNPESARLWAMRLGADPQEAVVFSLLTADNEIWDFLSGLIARSDILRFQPWIARDVAEYIRRSNLPIDVSYDAIHVRRGDKLVDEARVEVANYWRLQGYQNQEDFPTNYVPFDQYLKMGWGGVDACEEIDSHGMVKNSLEVKRVYIATDDPHVVWQEIKSLFKSPGENTFVLGCHQLHFIFSPAAQNGSTSFHIKAKGFADECAESYERNIWAMADLMLLTKSDKFIGDYNSNWGRLIRIFRVELSRNLEKWMGEGGTRESPVLVRDTSVAFGPSHPGVIGW